MCVYTNEWIRGLAALIYYENLKKIEKAGTEPVISPQFEELTQIERVRYILIAESIVEYIEGIL